MSKMETGDFQKNRRDEGYDMLGAYNTADRVRIKKIFAGNANQTASNGFGAAPSNG